MPKHLLQCKDVSTVHHEMTCKGMAVLQQVSNFINTTTGVNGSPTLTKRELSTAVTMSDGDVIVLGGLNENKESSAESGLPFLPSILRSNSKDQSKSEILLILQVTRI